MPASTVRKSGGQIAEKSPPIALPIAKSISVPSTLTLGDGRRILFWELAAKSAKGRAADIARVREPYCNKLVIDNLISIGNAAKLPFRDRSVLVKDTGHRSGTSERRLLQAGFGEFKTEAGPVR